MTKTKIDKPATCNRSGFYWAVGALLVAALFSVPALYWFGQNWRLSPDGAWYLLQGSNLISDRGHTGMTGGIITIRGPVFAGVLGSLMLVFGLDTESLAWAARVLAISTPWVTYFLVRRFSGVTEGLLAAALVALFGYTATLSVSFSIDSALLPIYLLSVLALLAVVRRGGALLAVLSGLLLGASVLTKETSFVGLPLALFAALLLGWNLRGLLLHYAAVILVCLPWWVRIYRATGQVYLLGSPPPVTPSLPVVAACVAAVLVVAVLLYRSRIVHRVLASASRRRLLGWSVLVAWVLCLCAVSLNTNADPSALTLGNIRTYVTGKLWETTPLLPALPLAAAYVVWKAVRGNTLWELYLALLVIQIPPSLVAFVEQLNTRQLMLPQTLLLGALAALVVDLCRTALRRRAVPRRRLPGALAAVGLVGFLAVSSVLQLGELLAPSVETAEYRDHNNRAVLEMHRWMADNVPEGEKVSVNWMYSSYLAFLDDGKHQWAPAGMGRKVYPRDLRKLDCEPGQVTVAPSGRSAVSQGGADCKAIASALSDMLKRTDKESVEYLLLTAETGGRNTLPYARYFTGSGAYEEAHSSLLGSNKRTGQLRGLILLKRTEG